MPAPPPEKPEAARARSNIVFSFWAVVLFLGLPTWWYTTSIPRAGLPTYDMLDWEGKHPSYQIDVQIAAPDLRCDPLYQLTSAIQTLLDERNTFSAFKINVKPVRFTTTQNRYAWSDQDMSKCPQVNLKSEEERSALDIEIRKGSEFAIDFLGANPPFVGIYDGDRESDLALQLTEKLEIVFAEEKVMVAYEFVKQGNPTDDLQQYMASLSSDILSGIAKSTSRAFKPAPEYHLTFSLFTATGAPSSWNIASALQRYVQPLAHSLSATSRLSITTQVQMYSAMSPSIQPHRVEGMQGSYLTQNDLTAFINAAEWPLSPSIGSGPTINFILYVPSKNQLPLQIQGSNSSSWIVPQWGGISILDPPLMENSDTKAEIIVPYLDLETLQKPFEIFQTQLLLLLGIPASATLPLDLRLKAFQRLSGVTLYFRATSNLGSLARLAQRLSNIPIPHHVSELVGFSIAALMHFHNHGGFRAAQSAYLASEKAFFDKAMVGQVYFPDEHKVAVYLPLLGPIGVPLVVGLLREIKQRVSKK